MDIILKDGSKRNMPSEMRNAGYFFLEEKTGPSFVRPMGRSGYPRFHIYMEKNTGKDEIIIKLHLDQKRPVYPVRSPSQLRRDGRRQWRLTSNGVYRGVSAHSGEYDGRVVETEAERIRQILG